MLETTGKGAVAMMGESSLTFIPLDDPEPKVSYTLLRVSFATHNLLFWNNLNCLNCLNWIIQNYGNSNLMHLFLFVVRERSDRERLFWERHWKADR